MGKGGTIMQLVLAQSPCPEHQDITLQHGCITQTLKGLKLHDRRNLKNVVKFIFTAPA